MPSKIILFVCQAFLVQNAFTQCIGNAAYSAGIAAPYNTAPAGLYNGFAAADLGLNGNAWAYDGAFAAGPNAFGPAYGAALGVAPASGGRLPIASTSPIAPTGLIVRSDNAIEGILAVTGQMPFVSAVALEGVLPTAGSGAIAYGCGDGTIGIVSELGIVGNAYVAPDFAYSGLPAGNFGFSGLPAGNFGYSGLPAARGPCGCGSVF